MNCRLLSLALLLSSLGAQGLKITHMEGTYDLDGDGLQEFASVELGSSSNKKLSVIRYYELDEDNYQQMRWELETPEGLLGNFVDAEAVVSDNLICCPHYKWMGQWMAKVIEINSAV